MSNEQRPEGVGVACSTLLGATTPEKRNDP